MNATAQQVTVNANAEKFVDWAISSQAGQEWAEGSTTSESNPDRMKSPRARSSMPYEKITGVYCIKHEETGFVYIGSAVCVKGRMAMHRRELRLGIHANHRLQRLHDMHGASLQYVLIEACDREVLRQREQFYIDSATSKLLNIDRNVCELAPADEHSRRMKAAWSKRDSARRAEIGLKISKTLKARYADDPAYLADNAKRLAAARSGERFKERHQSADANQKRAEATRQHWQDADTVSDRVKRIKASMEQLRNVPMTCGYCDISFVGRSGQKWCSPRCRMAAFHGKAKAC